MLNRMELTDNELYEILNNYLLGELEDFSRINSGIVNDNWLIKTKDKKYILRCANKDKDSLGVELSFTKIIFENGFNYRVPLPIISNQKKPFVIYKEKLFWLYEFIDGEIKSELTSELVEEVAIMMANLHNIIEKSNLDLNNSDYNLEKNLEELIRYKNISAEKNDKFSIYFYKNVNKMIDVCSVLEISDIRRFPIHRDINLGNLIFKDNRIVGIIDFDQISGGKDYLVRDISNFFLYCLEKESMELNLNLVKVFLDKYKELREITQKEMELIIKLMVINCVEDFVYEYKTYLKDSDKSDFDVLKQKFMQADSYYKKLDLFNSLTI
ncbi:MAG: phosphotransferase [Candidatus Pacearchaeota archaeon]|nr:phosphotransferase [Candidatus Pacearchaeota archaeon]